MTNQFRSCGELKVVRSLVTNIGSFIESRVIKFIVNFSSDLSGGCTPELIGDLDAT